MRPDAELPSFTVLGRRYYTGDLAAASAWMLERRAKPRVVCVANVHTLITALWDKELRQAQDWADLSLADGKPLSLAGKILGAWEAVQLRGPDLMLSLARAGVGNKTRHYYFGGAPGMAEAAAERIKALAPGLVVCGAESPPYRDLSDAELNQFIGRLRKAKADIVWVGMGAPKQEKVMARLAALGAPCVMIGVGAGFDYFGGAKPEAPRWMMNMSLEWLFRLASEPGRLWKRYLSTNPLFLALLLSEHFGLYLFSSMGMSERVLRLICLPPLFEAAAQGRPLGALAALLMPAWLGRLFWLAKH